MNHVTINCDLYIHRDDLKLLEIGGEVNGYKQVNYPNQYELISQFAFLPAIQLDDNTFRVCAILK